MSAADIDALFKSSSSSVEQDAQCTPHAQPLPVSGVSGLFIVKRCWDEEEQALILDGIEHDGWLANNNQAMHFGADLPEWLLDCLSAKAPLFVPLLPKEVSCRRPLFNQMILNRYRPGDGLCAHIDLMRFEDGIIVISLGSPAVMHFTQPDRNPQAQVQVLLEGGDLLVLGGEARWEWHHEIKGVTEEEYEGRRIVRGIRTSITLRRLKEGIVLTESA